MAQEAEATVISSTLVAQIFQSMPVMCGMTNAMSGAISSELLSW